MPAETLVAFAELVFAYIDELSAASVAGHTDELATTGRVRQRLLERIAHHLLEGASPETVLAAAERAGWDPPTTLTAVLVPESQVRPVLGGHLAGDPAGRRPARARRHGPAAGARRPRTPPRRPAARARRARLRRRPGAALARGARVVRPGASGPGGSASRSTPRPTCRRWCCSADPDALADLRARALAPLAGLRPGTAEKLADTLRSWLLHQGRRDDIAAALFVHPQTVRYRMGQLRDLYGDRLEDPDTVLELMMALALPREAVTE